MPHHHHAPIDLANSTTTGNALLDLLKALFANDYFHPHGYCYYWQPGLLWLHLVSDLLIGTAYVAISLILYLLVRRIKVPFSGMFLAFGLFIGACGATHFMEIWTLWTPNYWLAGIIKAITAVASVATAALIFPLGPKVEALVIAADLAEVRRVGLENANQELETLYARMKDVDELKTQFFANVSHELRTPLALILGPAEKLAIDATLTDKQRHDMAMIARNAHTLLKHVNDLLDLAKIEARRMAAEYAEIDLARLVRVATAQFETVAEERGIRLASDAPDVVTAQVDPRKLEQVFVNLVANAIKFTPGGGEVKAWVRTEGDRVRVGVQDSGPGIPEEMRGAIFERFVQAEGGTTRRFGGTGLGLAIAKDFVELHHGRITVDEAPGGGALFTVDLPLHAPEGAPVRVLTANTVAVSEEATRQAVASLKPAEDLPEPDRVTPVRSAHGTVLVVEDNPDMNRFVAETLATDFAVVTARDGLEGLDRAVDVRPDLILTDMMMPGRSGAELLREVRAHETTKHIPVVLLTAKGDEEMRVRMLREGAQDYLSKPFSAEELRARVGNLVAIKRTRDLLQNELTSHRGDLESLAGEVSLRRRELQTALEAMRLARDQAETASRVKTTFLSLVSHELRTPLTTVLLQLSAVEKSQTLGSRERNGITRASSAAGRLATLIDSILEHARIESGRLVAAVEPVDVRALVAGVIDEAMPRAEHKHIALRLAPGGAIEPLRSDSRLVRLVVVNLVDNAIKYTAHGHVEVAVDTVSEGHRVVVSDTGEGVPEALQATIFEPFVQLEAIEHKHTPGVGLGLAIVRELVGALGGRITLHSEVGAGSAFTVVFPALGEQAHG